MSRSVFMAVDPFPGINPKLRRAISQVDFDAPYLAKCMEACAKLKWKAITPVYEDDVWAHIGIPALKIVLYFRNVHDTERIAKDRAAWAKHGWTMLFAMTEDVAKLTADQMAAHLSKILKELQGSKR